MSIGRAITEDKMFELLCKEVKRRYKTKLPNPDYRTKAFLPAQWKQFGWLRYYKVGGDFEPILAVVDKIEDGFKFYFNAEGFHPSKVKELTSE